MAKKRLNKKVALIGSALFVFAVLITVAAILYFSRDPHKFISDGDLALQSAREAADDQTKELQYKEAERDYRTALGLAKNDSLKIDVFFKLVGLYSDTDEWRKVIACWNGIIQLDQRNLKARYGRLEYFYLMAGNGVDRAWQDVASQATEFIESIEDSDSASELLAKDTSELEPPGLVGDESAPPYRLGTYLYLLRGRATMEMVRMGAVTNKEESLDKAVGDLEKVRELDPTNAHAYWYLARAAISRGDILASRGKLDERQTAREKALKLLEHAVEVADSDMQAHINLMRMKLVIARSSEAADRREKILALEPEYLALTNKFPSSPEVFAALCRFYAPFDMLALGNSFLDQAINAIEKATALAPENATYATTAAELYYRRYVFNKRQSDFDKALDTAKKALAFPELLHASGPKLLMSRSYKAELNGNLAYWCLEQILENRDAMTESQIQGLLQDIERCVHEIEQILGSGENPQVAKWQGFLELASSVAGSGDRNAAIQKLYAAYEQLKASGRSNSILSYELAKLFANSPESGAAMEFLASAMGLLDSPAALKPGFVLTNPEALLDYAVGLVNMRAYNSAIAYIRLYEQIFGPNRRSRFLQINAYIGERMFEQAERQMEQLPADDPNSIMLKGMLAQAKIRHAQTVIAQKRRRVSIEGLFDINDTQMQVETRELPSDEKLTAQLKASVETLRKSTEDLLSIEPNVVDAGTLAVLCKRYINWGQFKRAQELTAKYLAHFPDDTTALLYKLMLAEPEPDKISQQRLFELREQALLSIAEPPKRALSLGVFYRKNDKLDKAVEQFNKVLDLTSQAPEQRQLRIAAAGALFDIALMREDMQMAEQVASTAQRENLDDCSGKFYAARLDIAGEKYEDALSDIDAVLKQKPVFSYAYLLRHKINSALANEQASMADIQTAARIRPDDSIIAKSLASALYTRDQKLGGNVSSAQRLETRAALDRAIALNSGDLQLLSFYAEYISPTEPERAMAVRQRLQRVAPSMANAMLLAKMAIRMSLEQDNEDNKKAFLDIAGSALDQAKTYKPENQDLLETCGEYYRLTGREDKAEQLLSGPGDWKLLWRHHVRAGDFAKASEVLKQAYKANPKDPNVLEGFLYLAEQTGDKENASKYSEELLAVKDTVQTNLMTIQAFLRVGLVKQADSNLKSFQEKNPGEPRGMLLGAWLAMSQGRLQDALKQTNRYLEVEQESATGWRLRGQINRLLANYDQAVADLRKSRLLSDEPVTRVELARAYLRSGRVEDAITELKSTIENPQAPRPARILLEGLYWRLRKTDVLKKFYQETLEKMPDSIFWLNRAAGFAMSTKDIPKAEQLFERAWQKSIQQGNGDRDAFAGYLQTLLQGGKLGKLFEQAAKYVDSDFASIAYFRMAQARLRLGDKENAVKYCRKAIEKAGSDEQQVTNTLQKTYSLLGPDEAEKLCSERLAAAPDSFAENWMMFGLMRLRGRYNKALDYVDKCIEITGPGGRRRLHCIMKKTEVLILAYSKTSDKTYLQKAVSEYESLLREMPNNTGVLNNLAYILAENDGDLDIALNYIKQAVDLKPDEPGFLDTYAYVLYKRGEYSKASETVQSALQQYETQGLQVSLDVYEHAGQIYEKLGQTDQAVAAYEQALEAGGDNISKAVKDWLTSAITRLK